MFCSLISGSSGNATLISDGAVHILVDCGMSGKKLSETLAQLDLTCADLHAVLLTHEHIDHSRGIGVLARRYKLPLYATEKTFQALSVGEIPSDLMHTIQPGKEFALASFGVLPCSVLHDAADPVGYTFSSACGRYAIATDTGEISPELEKAVSGCDCVLLEANHDPDMLMYGSYPYALKQRILGKYGHLSNHTAAEFALRLAQSGTKKILLGHLSAENNTPEIAYQTVCNTLTSAGATPGKELFLDVADRYTLTRLD